jgi:hypothetical protein
MLQRIDTSRMPNGACVTSEDHPADENQGRGLDHLAGPSYFSSVVWWLIAGVVFCLLAMAQVLMGDQL